jgi:hypothetical protein
LAAGRVLRVPGRRRAGHAAGFKYRRLARVLHRGDLMAGEYRLTWDGREEGERPASCGVYLVRVADGHQSACTRVALVR